MTQNVVELELQAFQLGQGLDHGGVGKCSLETQVPDLDTNDPFDLFGARDVFPLTRVRVGPPERFGRVETVSERASLKRHLGSVRRGLWRGNKIGK